MHKNAMQWHVIAVLNDTNGFSLDVTKTLYLTTTTALPQINSPAQPPRPDQRGSPRFASNVAALHNAPRLKRPASPAC